MDIELSSLAALLLANGLIIFCITIFLIFFYKWDNKVYDDLAEKVENYREVGLNNDMFLGVNASQIESLLDKDESTAQYPIGQANKVQERYKLSLDLTSIASRHGANSIYSHRHSLLTYDRSQSILAFGAGNKQGPYQQSEYNDDMQGNQELGAELMAVERPKSWLHLLQTLWQVDEYKLLRIQNADGYFYLLYLKRCGQLFAFLTLLSMTILLPSYTVLHDAKFNFILPDIKVLDSFTLADSLQNPQIIWIVLILTFLYSTLAYYTIIKFSQKMSTFEFSPGQQYIDSYASQHSIMIRGVNKNIGVDMANYLIRKVFEERFGHKKVISVHTIRKTDNVQYLFRKKQAYKQRVEQFRMSNNFQGEQRVLIQTGSNLKCNKRLVDAENYYQKKLDKVTKKFDKLKESYSQQNVGLAFVSFKVKDCVTETIEEIDIVKTKLVGKEHFDALDIKNWEVEPAMPTNDIIWHEINKGQNRSFIIKLFLWIIPLVLSSAFVGGLIYFDLELKFDIPDYCIVFFKYVTPLLLILFAFYCLPYIIFKIVQLERHERKSEKEDNFMSKNIIFIILNTLILPIIFSGLITGFETDYAMVNPTPELPKFPNNVVYNHTTGQTKLFSNRLDNDMNEFMARFISNSEEFFTRYLLQTLLVIILFQMYVPSEKIMKAFHQMLSSGGKTKFKHWFYDLGFKNALAVSVFTFSLFFSIIIPLLLPISTLLFFLAYYIDKYNLVYIYPIDFDSKQTSRRSLIVYSIFGIIFFQLGMFIISGSVMSKRVSIYLFAFLVIQAMVLFTTFEFIRKPWEGKELEVEKAVQQQANFLFESISSDHSENNEQCGNQKEDANLTGGGSIQPFNQIGKTRKEKIQILSRAYENPLDVFFLETEEQDEFQGLDESAVGVLSPKMAKVPNNLSAEKYNFNADIEAATASEDTLNLDQQQKSSTQLSRNTMRRQSSNVNDRYQRDERRQASGSLGEKFLGSPKGRFE